MPVTAIPKMRRAEVRGRFVQPVQQSAEEFVRLVFTSDAALPFWVYPWFSCEWLLQSESNVAHR
jgi:hypothetical protein